MARDILFLLAPGFTDEGRREYCPECAEMWGVLSYFPAIRDVLEVRYQPLAHPRPGLVELLGEGEWNCPTLVLADGADPGSFSEAQFVNGRVFLDNAGDIGKYFARQHGTPLPRGR